jgi:hypothetical protein
VIANVTIAVLSVLWLVLSYTDLTQTLRLQRMGAIEKNLFLGPHPKPGMLKAFAILTTLGWLGGALWIAYKGADDVDVWVCGLLTFGSFLRLKTVVDNRELHKELTGAKEN